MNIVNQQTFKESLLGYPGVLNVITKVINRASWRDPIKIAACEPESVAGSEDGQQSEANKCSQNLKAGKAEWILS